MRCIMGHHLDLAHHLLQHGATVELPDIVSTIAFSQYEYLTVYCVL
jgi:hypothetical protein